MKRAAAWMLGGVVAFLIFNTTTPEEPPVIVTDVTITLAAPVTTVVPVTTAAPTTTTRPPTTTTTEIKAIELITRIPTTTESPEATTAGIDFGELTGIDLGEWATGSDIAYVALMRAIVVKEQSFIDSLSDIYLYDLGSQVCGLFNDFDVDIDLAWQSMMNYSPSPNSKTANTTKQKPSEQSSPT